jgi:hypothetical protein
MATASAKSVVYSRPGIHVTENFEAVLVAGLDEVRKRESNRPREGAAYFRSIPMSKRTHTFQSYYGLGTVQQNRDSEDLPYDTMGLGFDWTLTTNTFRGAISIEQELIEDELYGVIRDRQQELVESEGLTRELIMCDWFNRGLGTSGAPALCEDGMYFIDSSRPNAFKMAGSWSNLEATGAITPTGIYTAQLNFAAYRDERGQLSPMKLSHLVIRPNEEKTVWEILQSDLRPTDAMNAANFQKGRFSYQVYNMLTSGYVYYAAADGGFQNQRNELYFGERAAPDMKTWTSNGGDVYHQRIRTRYGIGCGRPHFWRGAALA